MATDCHHTDVMRQMAQSALRDYMDVPPERVGTSVDFSGFGVVCCEVCGCPLALKKEIDLLENYKLLLSMSEVADAD